MKIQLNGKLTKGINLHTFSNAKMQYLTNEASTIPFIEVADNDEKTCIAYFIEYRTVPCCTLAYYSRDSKGWKETRISTSALKMNQFNGMIMMLADMIKLSEKIGIESVELMETFWAKLAAFISIYKPSREVTYL